MSNLTDDKLVQMPLLPYLKKKISYKWNPSTDKLASRRWENENQLKIRARIQGEERENMERSKQVPAVEGLKKAADGGSNS